MEKSGIAGDVVVYGAVLDACAQVGDGERAKRVFEQMRSLGIKPNIISYAALIRPFANKGDWEEVERQASQMLSENIPVNEYFLYSQLKAYSNCKPKQPDRAEIAFRDAFQAGVQVNSHVMGVLNRVP